MKSKGPVMRMDTNIKQSKDNAYQTKLQPTNPSIFATLYGRGYIDLWDLKIEKYLLLDMI